MRFAFWVATAMYAAVVAVAAARLPVRVPLHFGASGQPDRWGSRAEAVLTFAGVGAGLVVLLGGAAALVDRVSLRSSLVNLPHKQWWLADPAREAEARRRLRADLYGIGAATLLLLCLVVGLALAAARSDEPALGWPFVLATGAYLLGVLGWAVWCALGRYRPEEDR